MMLHELRERSAQHYLGKIKCALGEEGSKQIDQGTSYIAEKE